MDTLRDTYQSIVSQCESLKRELNNFECQYSATFLSGFLGDLNTINMLISEIYQYDTDIVKTLFHSDSSVIQYAKKQVEILGYRKIKIQNLMNNLKFSETYQSPTPLYFPPLCPTENCPYYKTHPVTIRKKLKTKSDAEEQLLAYQNELKDLDVEIYKYSDYPVVYSKISTLRGMWDKAQTILDNIGALRVQSLLQIITMPQYQVWYNYDKVVDTIDLINKRDMYFELSEKMKKIKSEINELSLSDTSNIDMEISRLETERLKFAREIEESEIEYGKTQSDLKEYNQIYVNLSEKSIHEETLERNRTELENAKSKLSLMELNDEKIQINTQKIQSINTDIFELSQKLKEKSILVESLKAKYNDIKYTNSELETVVQEQKYMTVMVDAVSSKKGIPLVMIQMFLDSCREIVNSLIYDVVEDDVEILPFQINETEFKIPYMVNGVVIDDISKASQGQTSIVSTAMSFALLRQSGAIEYNIPLLDEVDGPLHKSDKRKFISILLKHLKENRSEQCFVITHDDNTFDGYPVQVIMTTDEIINQEKYPNVIRL
jgi:DNA repair exonuclease SbcCD ATPase subunit